MGRATYEFGYAFGMAPGNNPYPHMRTLVLSKTLSLPLNSEVEQIATDAVEYVRELKGEIDTAIYLCGGGALAGSLARAGMIDILILKRIPIILGGGTRLFGDAGVGLPLTQTNFVDYGEGMFLQTFRCGAPRE
jgi:dihydrofolate reductase